MVNRTFNISPNGQKDIQQLFQGIDLDPVTDQAIECVVRGVLDRLCQLIPCDAACLTLFDFETNEALQIARNVSFDTSVGLEKRVSLALYSQIVEGRQCQPYLIKDLPSLPNPTRLEKIWLADGLWSLLEIPLMTHHKPIGALDLGLMTGESFSTAQILLACDTTGYLASTVGQIWSLSLAQSRARELASLNKAAQAITSSLDLNTVLKQIMAEINTIIAAEGSAVLLYDPDRNDLIFAAAASPAAEMMTNKRVPIATSIAGWSVREKRPIIIGDAQQDTRFYNRIDQLTGLTTHSILSVPLIFRDEVIGVLETTNKLNGAFNRHDVELLETLASSAAIAIANAKLFEQVQTGRKQLRHLTQQVVEAQEEERRRLSYILHDESGQALIALKMKLELMQMDLPVDAEIVRQNLAEVIALADTTMERLRSLARDLRPPALDAAGLNPTLAGLCREFGGWSQIRVDYKGVNLPQLPDPAKICFYRVLQEALTNVAKHAQANQVWVRLDSDRDQASLTIRDDGQGFDPRAGWSNPGQPKGIGLTGIQERLELLGGRLEIFSQAGQGTCLSAHIPWEGL